VGSVHSTSAVAQGRIGVQGFLEPAAAAEAFEMLDVGQRGKASQHVSL
jgi:hypothetical protein